MPPPNGQSGTALLGDSIDLHMRQSVARIFDPVDVAASLPMDCITDAHAYIERYLWLKTSKYGVIDELRPFKLNGIQRYYAAEKARLAQGNIAPRFLVLKYRRGGITTYEQALSFWMSATQQRKGIITMAQTRDDTREIFEIVNRFYRYLEEDVRPFRSPSKTELRLPDMDTVFSFATAGAKGQKRGSTLSRVHCSEQPQWKLNREEMDNLMVSLLRAAEYGEVVIETTARGAAGWFYEKWMEAIKGNGIWKPIFLAWYMDPENRIPLLEGEELTYSNEEEEVAGRYGLDAEQIKFRRHITAETGRLRPQEYPENWEEAFLASGHGYFDSAGIRDLSLLTAEPVEQREFLTIWQQPEEDEKYFMGVDTGEGLEDGDFTPAGVLNEAGEQVARLHGRWRPSELAKRAALLGHMYNNALMGVEANNTGHAVLGALQDNCHYDNVFMHYGYSSSPSGFKLGWQTNAKTRPMMLADLEEAVRMKLMKVNDKTFLAECSTFADDGTGKFQAQAGCHDDLVMMWAIAWQVRKAGNTSFRVRGL